MFKNERQLGEQLRELESHIRLVDHGRERAEIEENQDAKSGESLERCAKRREDEGNGKAYEGASYGASEARKTAE